MRRCKSGGSRTTTTRKDRITSGRRNSSSMQVTNPVLAIKSRCGGMVDAREVNCE